MSEGSKRFITPLKKGHYPIQGLHVLCYFKSCPMTGKLAWRRGRASLVKILIYTLLPIIWVWPCAYPSPLCRYFLSVYFQSNVKVSKCSKRSRAFFDCWLCRIIFNNGFTLLSWRMVQIGLDVHLSDLDSWMLSLYLSSSL